MLDHVGLCGRGPRSDPGASTKRALEPLGMTLIMTVTPDQTEGGGTAHGFGVGR